MSDKIMKALRPDFVNRMREWAMASITPDCSTVPSSWPSDGPLGDSAGHNPMRIPRLLGRVHDTQSAIEGLPPRYRYAVCQFWWYEGRSLREHARHRQVSYFAFTTWVEEGHERLKQAFAVQADNWHRRHDQGGDDGRMLACGLRPIPHI